MPTIHTGRKDFKQKIPIHFVKGLLEINLGNAVVYLPMLNAEDLFLGNNNIINNASPLINDKIF